MTTTVSGAAPSTEAVTARAWRVPAVTSLGAFILLLDTTIVNIATPASSAAFPSATKAAL